MELELKLCQCQTGLQIGRDRSNEQADGRLWPTRIVCDSPSYQEKKGNATAINHAAPPAISMPIITGVSLRFSCGGNPPRNLHPWGPVGPGLLGSVQIGAFTDGPPWAACEANYSYIYVPYTLDMDNIRGATCSPAGGRLHDARRRSHPRVGRVCRCRRPRFDRRAHGHPSSTEFLVARGTPLIGIFIITAGMPRHRRLVSSSIPLDGHTTVDGRICFHCRLAFVAVDWCPRLYGWLVTPPLMGVYALTIDCLHRRQPVSSLTWLVRHTTIVGHLHLYRRPPSSPPTGFFASTRLVYSAAIADGDHVLTIGCRQRLSRPKTTLKYIL
uniref:Uncharacterized protein n=1 Tax=Oryza sativa subsp. japonica TaxID=39947 RepID=Q9AUN0_ORYSJ|nr:Hypothetical protein [Oryza sativa Japonica Group]